MTARHSTDLCAEITKDQEFGRWTVIGTTAIRKGRKTYWLCRCVCGTEKPVNAWNLYHGKTESCGCLSAEVASEGNRTHGMTGSREYHCWFAMKKRCYDIKYEHYHRYGGRGIKVCERWLNSFEDFLADMGPMPPGGEVDRYPDNDGDYTPGNTRWANRKEQCRNKGNNRRIEHLGETRTLTEWSEVYGLLPQIVGQRLNRGWSIERALTTPADWQKTHSPTRETTP